MVEFTTAMKNATENDRESPENKAVLLQLGDRAMDYTRKAIEVQVKAAEVQTKAAEHFRLLTRQSKGGKKKDREPLMKQAQQFELRREEYILSAKKTESRLQKLDTLKKSLDPNNGANVTAPINSGLNLNSNIDIVTQILESSQINAPAHRRIDTSKTQKTDGPKSEQSQKETLGHVAKSVESKECGQLSSKDLGLTALDVPMTPVPGVSFGLDRVLFNPGVYQLRDPRSRVYNFDPYLGEIMPVTEFDFDTLKPYVTSSQDVTASEMTAKAKKKYYGSSSSMTSALSHFHYLLSAWRPIDCRTVSRGFSDTLRTFTRLLRAPTAMFVHYKEKEDIYAIDADKEFDGANILMNLGKSMEKLLTLPKEDFERYRRSSANKVTPEEEEAVPESYHYTTAGKFLMRSQLDAYDPRLPGTGMFDLKTRAVVSIRMDASNHESGMGYEIKNRFGLYESYEREYFDMMRAAFLKYSLQVRVGRMDGIFVAYHNIQRIFGFQYISLSEMDQSMHGQTDTALGDKEFELSLGLWEKILDKATAKFPKQSLRFHFETREAVKPFMYIFAQPVTNEQIHAIQTSNAAEVQAFQDKILNSEQLASKTMEPDEPTFEAGPAAEPYEDQPDDYDENILAMTLLINNKVNGNPVERPTNFRRNDTWTVDYELNELHPKKGHALLTMCKRRRAAVLEKADDAADNADRNEYMLRLKRIAQEGRKFRQREDIKDREDGIVVYKDSSKSA
jgi:hypothetical protein